jgi:flagellar basal body rod protein FlgB
MDRERASFAQNSIMYQFAVNLMSGEYEDFRMASSDPLKG